MGLIVVVDQNSQKLKEKTLFPRRLGDSPSHDDSEGMHAEFPAVNLPILRLLGIRTRLSPQMPLRQKMVEINHAQHRLEFYPGGGYLGVELGAYPGRA